MPGFTLLQLEAMERAIASGTLRVRYDGKEVQYQDLDSMLKARAVMRDELIDAGILIELGLLAGARGMSSVTEFSRD
jgi:hypothetical protein